MAEVAGRIDAHQHFFDPARFDYPWMTGPEAGLAKPFGPDDLRGELRRVGIAGTVAVQACHDEAETLWLLALADDVDFVLGVVGWVDLSRPDVAERLQELRSLPGGERLVGIRHQTHDEPDPDFLGRPEVRRGVAAVVEAGLAFDLLVRTREVPAAVSLARAFPEGRFVLDHLAKPPLASGSLEAWSAALGALGECPNVVAKCSGLVTEADWARWTPAEVLRAVRVAVACFGPGRLMAGSDWPVCTLAGSYEEVMHMSAIASDGWSPSERQALWSDTARRAYRLRDPLEPAGRGSRR